MCYTQIESSPFACTNTPQLSGQNYYFQHLDDIWQHFYTISWKQKLYSIWNFFFASLSQILWFEVKCNLMEMFHLMDVSVSLEAWKWSEKSRDIKSWDFHFQLSYHLTHSCRWCLVWICEARSKQKEIRPHAAPWNFYPFNSIMNDQRWRLPTDAKMWWRVRPIPKYGDFLP